MQKPRTGGERRTASKSKKRRRTSTRLWLVLILLGAVGLPLTVYLHAQRGRTIDGQLQGVGVILDQSQRLMGSAPQAMLGSAPAFAAVNDSATLMQTTADALRIRPGASELFAANAEAQASLQALSDQVQSAYRNAQTVVSAREVFTVRANAIAAATAEATQLSEMTEQTLRQAVRTRALDVDWLQLSRLSTLASTFAKELQQAQSVTDSAQLLASLGSDVDEFGQIINALITSNPADGYAAVPPLQAQFMNLTGEFDELRRELSPWTSSQQVTDAADSAYEKLQGGADGLRQTALRAQADLLKSSSPFVLPLLLVSALLLAGVVGYARARLHLSRLRHAKTDALRRAAVRQEQDAKQSNEATQSAILRLMDELQMVAEGDLTQNASVTTDITGAIADSINATVEQLRKLVADVQTLVAKVVSTTGDVDMISMELLATSVEQLREIRDTGSAVLSVAGRMNVMSAATQAAARVSHESRVAASVGRAAVQETVAGMGLIRDQIQDTSKRIKRLSESSQEIGEMTAIIANIAEQTNTLALNAAIRASATGEAGRLFAPVVEEIRRLAQRASEATRQIAVLVEGIQGDTQGVVSAMERSTHGVVDGAKRSDLVEEAFTTMDNVSRELESMVDTISTTATQEAAEANRIAGSIQHIFAVTEQTGDHTRVANTRVRELAETADELLGSVARFKI